MVVCYAHVFIGNELIPRLFKYTEPQKRDLGKCICSALAQTFPHLSFSLQFFLYHIFISLYFILKINIRNQVGVLYLESRKRISRDVWQEVLNDDESTYSSN
jgi:hypothetical protein